jgi:phosphohistidine swiveling domain-containing protein
VLRPPAGSVTVRINAALWALGRADAGERPERLVALIAAHGHRASASWEVWSRRWAEDPAGVLALASIAADGPDPARRALEADRAAEARIAELSPAMRRAVALARDYLRLREEQRWNLDRILWALKRQLRALGADWLDDADDLRFLEVDEIEAGAAGTLSTEELRARAERRRAEPVEPHPADFLDGGAVAAGVARPRGVDEERATHGRVQGLGISPGVARGRARVLHSVADGARLQPGEILVARATDPSWTPLFARAGGLVLELGSMLSHGAVVAREYRLPGVVNVVGATERFADGMELTVDGGAGVVWAH